MTARPTSPAVVAVLAALTLLAGCSSNKGGGRAADMEFSAVVKAAAPIDPTLNNTCKGIVWFYEQRDGTMYVVADLEGLNPGQQHAMHVHEKGDCSAPDGASAGGHYNPESFPHALPPNEPRHAGDLGNVLADSSGKAHYEIAVDNISIRGKNPIESRAVIVHAQVDDGGQPVGNAGGRIGCGVIAAR